MFYRFSPGNFYRYCQSYSPSSRQTVGVQQACVSVLAKGLGIGTVVKTQLGLSGLSPDFVPQSSFLLLCTWWGSVDGSEGWFPAAHRRDLD